MMSGFGIGGGLLMILFWGVLIFGAVWVIRSLFPGGTNIFSQSQDREESPKEILDRRYARGDISREEYERMKQDLAKS
jgi:putative membrane protein